MGREAVRLVTTGKGQRRLAMILHNYKTTRTTLAEKSKDRREQRRRGGRGVQKQRKVWPQRRQWTKARIQ